MEEETRRYRPTKNYLSYLPTPDFSTFEVRPPLPDASLNPYSQWDPFFSFFICIDRNYEERVWTSGSSAAHGSPQHEEVRLRAENTNSKTVVLQILVRLNVISWSLFLCGGMSCQHPPRDRRMTFRHGRNAWTTPWPSWNTRQSVLRT